MNSLISTNIEWLPYINSSWKIGRVKDIFYVSKELSTKKNPTVLSLARSAVKIRDISNNEGQIAASYDNYNSVKVGDLLLNPMDLYSGANCNVSFVEGVISPAYSNLRAKVKLEPRFYDFYFKVQYWTMAMFAHGKGVSFDNRWTLNNEALLNYEIPILSLEEQQRIVETLDRKISQIDKLISNQEKQIEKLNEYKNSVITKVVTKGMNKHITMKDSKIKWIGIIPNHWNLIRFKFLNKSSNTGEAIDKTYWSNNQKDLVFYTAGLKPIYSCYSLFPEEKYVKKNDLLLSRNGTPYVYIPSENSIYTDHIIRVQLNDKMHREYIAYALQQSILNVAVDSVSLPTWSISLWNEQTIPNPPKEEQIEIVKYLDNKCSEIDSLIKIKNQKIEKLQEYKKSLIYEYVTGKKQVA